MFEGSGGERMDKRRERARESQASMVGGGADEG